MFLDRLSRVSVSTRFVAEVDGLRFFAIGSVVLYHLMGIISVRIYGSWEPSRFDTVFPLNWVTQGHFGVPLFFAISGFVLAMPFADHHLYGREALPLPKYYLRRVARLGPPYLFNLVFLFVAVAASGHIAWDSWPHLVASLCYVHGWVYGTQSTVNGVAWSLETEVQFYLVAPFLCAVFLISKPWVRRGVIFCMMILAAVLVELYMPKGVDRWNGDVWRMSLLNYLQYFLVGFLLVDFYLCSWRGKAASGQRWLWDITGVGAWIFLWSNVAGSAVMQVLLPMAMLIAYAAAFRGYWLNAVVRNGWVFTIGGMCYTIYLWHQPILMTWGKIGLPRTWIAGLPMPLNVFVQFVSGFILVVLVGSVLFKYTERPFMKKEWYRMLWPSAATAHNGDTHINPDPALRGPAQSKMESAE